MTGFAVIACVGFGLAAGADWVARAMGLRAVELVAKPAATVALVVLAATLDPADASVRGWFVAALVCSLVGDVLLMWEDRLFLAGLVAFLLAHVAYVVGFWVDPPGAAAFAIGVVLTAAVIVPLAIRILSGVRSTASEMVGPVAGYVTVISVMVASAIGSANPFAIVGAGLFATSDAMIAWRRFIRSFAAAGVAIMVTYHLGQLGLVLSLL